MQAEHHAAGDGATPSPPEDRFGQGTEPEHQTNGSQTARPHPANDQGASQGSEGCREPGPPEDENRRTAHVERGSDTERLTCDTLADGDGRADGVHHDQRRHELARHGRHWGQFAAATPAAPSGRGRVMRHFRIGAFIVLNGPPGVGKSTIARHIRDDRPLSLLVDFDELWPLIGDWHHNHRAQELAFAAGLGMARVHLQAGYDVVAAQFAVGQDFFEAIDALVEETSAACHEVVLTGHPDRVAARFRERRAERTLAGEIDVSDNIPDDRVDDVIARATADLAKIAEARPHVTVISTDGGAEATYARAHEVLQRRDG